MDGRRRHVRTAGEDGMLRWQQSARPAGSKRLCSAASHSGRMSRTTAHRTDRPTPTAPKPGERLLVGPVEEVELASAVEIAAGVVVLSGLVGLAVRPLPRARQRRAPRRTVRPARRPGRRPGTVVARRRGPGAQVGRLLVPDGSRARPRSRSRPPSRCEAARHHEPRPRRRRARRSSGTDRCTRRAPRRHGAALPRAWTRVERRRPRRGGATPGRRRRRAGSVVLARRAACPRRLGRHRSEPRTNGVGELRRGRRAVVRASRAEPSCGGGTRSARPPAGP